MPDEGPVRLLVSLLGRLNVAHIQTLAHIQTIVLFSVQLYKDGSRVETIRTLSADKNILTYANRWVGKDGQSEVKSTQILQRVGELPLSTKSTDAGGDENSFANADESKGVGALKISGAPGFLNSLDTFVTGYETPPSGYATPPEEFDEDQISDALTRTLAGIESYQAGADQPEGKEEAGASNTTADDADLQSTDGPQEVKLKWMWADAGFSSKLAQANPFRWSSAMSPIDLKNNLLKQSKNRPLLITILGQKCNIRFPDMASAAAWIDETTAELETGMQQ